MQACDEDSIFAITSFLSPADIFGLAMASKRFGGSSAMARASTKRRPGTWPWSLMEEASRRRILAAKSDAGNPWRESDLIALRGEESWMAVDHRLHLLRYSLVFSRIIGSGLGYVDGDIQHVQWKRMDRVGFSVAICQEVMKSGSHFAEFAVVNYGAVCLGVIRPIHNWPKKRIKHDEYRVYCESQSIFDPGYVGSVNEYYYNCENSLFKEGDTVGLSVDLEDGSMTVFKNGKSLGARMNIGLAGHYCWAVKMNLLNNLGCQRPRVQCRKVVASVNKK
ncbi:hypothetical protein ACHAWF_009122 [Thalassiosira exigua]